MIDCPACETENRADRRYCRNCGTPLAIPCPSCQAANEPGDRFCGSCGSPLADDERPAATPPPVSGPSSAGETRVTERRLVSVLFADLVGFTGIAGGLDSEEVRELLSRYFEISRECIERYGGTVEKFIGDAIMAVWGTPLANEDDAERAVRAALELVDAVQALEQPADAGDATAIRVRAAVLTGEAAVTLGAVGQGMVAGDLVNTASRLQAVAEPGQVLVGESTYHAASSAIVFEPVGDRSLRGKDLPVPAWLALRVVGGRKGVGRSTKLEPPFVGRDDELRLLKDLLHATARESRARLISITGVAGIGKTRLAWELEKYVDGVADPIYWHQGRSPAYGEGVAFWALGEMVRERARIAETDAPEASRVKLRQMLEDYLDDPEERAWVEPRLAVLLGMEPAPAGEREELYAAWRRLFDRISERGPVVLVFEDLHWADEGLLDFIEALLAWSRDRPIYVLTLARPELLERRPAWGARQRSFTGIHLEPLSADALELLLVGLVPGIPKQLVEVVAQRAEGVPLYAVELVRMLLDQGRIVERDGRFHLLGDASDPDLVTLPNSLHALISARLDGLEGGERSLLQQAAVLGHSFTPSALAHLAGQPRDTVEQALRQLVRKELLVLDSDPRSPERGQYRFIQGLIREVAYGRLSRRDRAGLHEAAARYFEAIGDPELAGVVASHFVQAHEVARGTPAEAELRARAIDAVVSAAERAAALHNHAQAFSFLSDAIAIEPDEERRIALMARAGEASYAADLLDDGRRLYRQLVDWYREHGQVSEQADAMRRYGTTELFAEGGPPAAVRYLEAARAELLPIASDADLASVDAELARAYLMNGNYERAEETIDRVLPVAERLEQLGTIAELLASKGWAISELGRARESLAILRGALPFAEKVGFPNAYFRTAMNLSFTVSYDDPREGAVAALRAAGKADRFGYHGWGTVLAANAAYDLFLAGEWDDALRVHAEHDRVGLSASQRLAFDSPLILITTYRDGARTEQDRLASFSEMVAGPSLQDRTQYHEVAAHVAFGRRRFEDAYREAADMVATRIGQSPTRGGLLLARAALWLRDRERLEVALTELRSVAFHGTLASASERALRAGLWALDGRAEESREGYAEALATLDEIGAGWEAAMVRLERATFLAVSGEDARAFHEEARESLERLGASTLLAWLSSERQPEMAAEAGHEASPRP